ncbi:unnamed protein product [Bubo scandiacus]
MPSSARPGSLKDPEVAELFFKEDPEKLFADLREIGHGSFGAVYFARDLRTNEVVAIKKMSYSGKQSNEKWQDIVREVKFLQRLRHPNTIQYRGCYLRGHTAWLAMEYCLGSASDLLEVHKQPLQEVEIAAIAHGALQGLAYLHRHSMIHRGEGPRFTPPAPHLPSSPPQDGPEVILAMDEGQYDGRADVWSLGITCIELAEQRPPLFHLNAMSALYHIAQSPAPPCSPQTGPSISAISWIRVSKSPARAPGPRPRCSSTASWGGRGPAGALAPAPTHQSGPWAKAPRRKRRTRKKRKRRTRRKTKTKRGRKGLAGPRWRGRGAHGHLQQLRHPPPARPAPLSPPFFNPSFPSSLRRPQPLPPSPLPSPSPLPHPFATIRTASLVTRQARARARDHLGGYQRLRRHHQKQLLGLENRLRVQLAEHQLRLQRQLEAQRSAALADAEKLARRHQSICEKEAKAARGEERRFQQHLLGAAAAGAGGAAGGPTAPVPAAQGAPQGGAAGGRRHPQAGEAGAAAAPQGDAAAAAGGGRGRPALPPAPALRPPVPPVQAQDVTGPAQPRPGSAAGAHPLRPGAVPAPVGTGQPARLQPAAPPRAPAETRGPSAATTQKPATQGAAAQAAVPGPLSRPGPALQGAEVPPPGGRGQGAPTSSCSSASRPSRRARWPPWPSSTSTASARMLASQALQLDETQEAEYEGLRLQLEQELELLNAYQSKIKMRTEAQHEREVQELEQRVSVRRALLEQRIEEELLALQAERSERIRALLERHAREIEAFDAESLRLGFSGMALGGLPPRYARLALAAASFYLMPREPGPAAALYALSGLLDAVDGHVARLLGQG